MSFDRVTADRIKGLLADKHKEDIFVTECKMGSAGSRILDGWAMKKTWSPKTTIGYEIKVSRSDFLQDNKWQSYMGACHQFYFVCPWGLINKNELPAEVGLMCASKNGTRLYTKRKAVYKKDADVEELLMYILMSRSKIVSSTFGYKQYEVNKKKYWELWLKEKQLDSQFGKMVSRKISERLTKEVNRVEMQSKHVEAENRRLERLKIIQQQLSDMGLTEWDMRNVVDKGLGELLKKESRELKRNIQDMRKTMDRIENQIMVKERQLNESFVGELSETEATA